MIFQIFSIFLTSSCALKHFHAHDEWNFMQAKNKLEELIMTKDFNCLVKDKEYAIPYQDKDLEKQNYNILPPV